MYLSISITRFAGEAAGAIEVWSRRRTIVDPFAITGACSNGIIATASAKIYLFIPLKNFI